MNQTRKAPRAQSPRAWLAAQSSRSQSASRICGTTSPCPDFNGLRYNGSRPRRSAQGSFSTDLTGFVRRIMSASPPKAYLRSGPDRIEIGHGLVIQTLKNWGFRIMRYELTDYEWAVISPMLPNKPRGVRRVNDRRVLNGIFWVLRSGAPWRDLPAIFGPYTTCYNRFVRWRQAGVWGRIMNVLAGAHDAAVQMIDTSIVRVHQHGACITRNRRQSMGRSRGGLTSKIHAVVDTNGLPVRLALTAGEAHDNRLAGRLLSRSRCEKSFCRYRYRSRRFQN
jgi:transposase